MSQKKSSKKKTARAKNPAPFRTVKKQQRAKNGRRRVKNPGGLAGNTWNMLKMGALALAGLLVTKQLPQVVLGAKNTGWMGYLANIGTALGTAGAAQAVKKGAGAPVLIGGGLYVVDRVLTEQFSSAGKILSMSGAGDFTAAVNGTKGLRGVRTGYFPLPVQYDAAGNPVIPAAIIQAAQRGMLPAAAATAQPAAGSMGSYNRVNRPSRFIAQAA